MRHRTEAALGLGSPVLLAALVAAGSWLRDRRILENIFGEWSAEQVTELSGGVYRLTFSRPQFSWSRRRVRVDSIIVTTDPARRAAQSDPFPRVVVLFRKCELSGVAVVPLALGRGLRRANPEPGKPAREGQVEHAFSADESLPAFLWNGIKEGLVEVVRVNRGKKDDVEVTKGR